MKNLLGILAIVLFIVSCTDSRVKELESINAMEKSLFDSATMTPDVAKAQLLVTAFKDFAKKYPADTNSVTFLFKAAELNSGIGKPEESIAILEEILAKYADNKLIPTVLHYEGFLLEEKMKDTARAHITYQKLIDKFPNSELAESAKACIENLGKTPEEIIKAFEAQQSIKDSAVPPSKN